MDTKKWFSETSRQRVTDGMIADILNVTRKTANKRINDGLPMNDLVTISRALDINPAITLVELGHLTHEEIEDYLDSDGQLVSTAEDGALALELARRLNPATLAHEMDELAARRAALSQSNDQGHPSPDHEDDGTVREWTDHPHAADTSPDEQAGREAESEPPID